MAPLRSLSLILFFASLLVGCGRGRALTSSKPAAPAPDADAPNAAAVAPDSGADLAPDAVAPDAAAERDTRGDDADSLVPALLAPIRFHLRNDGPSDVYLGLRSPDNCAFDYAVTKVEPNVGGADAGPSSVIIESPMCPCLPTCSDCATCRSASCDELCDESPPLIAPGQERVLAWDGRRFDLVTVCGGVQCAAASLAALGRYGLTVPVFGSAAQPATGAAPARTANLSFELAGASVEGTDVDLSIRLP
jgi:hypothetical protein